jgi:hypothetical protein
LLLETLPDIPLAELVVDTDAFRGMAVRPTGIRGGMRDGVDSEGNVAERGIGDEPEPVGMADLLGWKPARWRRIDWPDADPREADWGRGVVVGAEGISKAGDRSDS